MRGMFITRTAKSSPRVLYFTNSLHSNQLAEIVESNSYFGLKQITLEIDKLFKDSPERTRKKLDVALYTKIYIYHLQ